MGLRSPPKNDGRSEPVQATPPSAKNATSIGTGPYIPLRTPNGRSSGKRSSTLPTSRRDPSNRSYTSHVPPVGPATHSFARIEPTPYPRTNSGYPRYSGYSEVLVLSFP